MKKAFRKIHLWLSVPFGVIITLICFSGAMLVFENEIMQMTHRHLYYVEKIGKNLSLWNNWRRRFPPPCPTM